MKSGRPEAAAAIWSWRNAEVVDTSLVHRHTRLRGGLQALVAVIAAGAFLYCGKNLLACITLGIGSIVGMAAVISPGWAYAAIERGALMLGRGVGAVVTWTLMPLVFWLVFLPFGILFRSGRHDPMKRFFDATAASYWTKRELTTDARLDHPF